MRPFMRATVAAVLLARRQEQVITADPLPDLMRALMAWAEAHTGLPVPDTMPIVVRKSHCLLQAMFRPDEDCAAIQSGAARSATAPASRHEPKSRNGTRGESSLRGAGLPFAVLSRA